MASREQSQSTATHIDLRHQSGSSADPSPMDIRIACAFFAIATLHSVKICAEEIPVHVMSAVQAESLSEVKILLPQGLPAERTLVLMGFEFDHQKIMDDWVEKLNLRANSQPWIQLHVISKNYGWIGGFINSRKRPYFPDAAFRFDAFCRPRSQLFLP